MPLKRSTITTITCMSTLNNRLAEQLNKRRLEGSLRSLQLQTAGIDFFSNDYLGIASFGLPERYRAPIPAQPGSTGSRLLSGNAKAFIQLEALIASHHKAEAAIVFNSGYDANAGLISALSGRHTILIYDELAHASIIDGVRSAIAAGRYKFTHNDVSDLETLLAKYQHGFELVVITESVFSMDGDVAPLREMASICERFGAHLIVDEAHATGVRGKHGVGLVGELGLEASVLARVHTFGKALGGFGAAIVCSGLVKEYLINFCRHFIYTTALPPSVIHHMYNVYRYLSATPHPYHSINEVIDTYCTTAHALNITSSTRNSTPIQVLHVPGNNKAAQVAAALQRRGFLVKPIYAPTVPAGKERIRICLHAYNTRFHVEELLKCVQEILCE